ncbi:MAG: hypothetical protein DRN54_00925 [Thaumarchaeota archaeon]|nr:MAG: hypothetical protein DRN54_00925 [Nitrososphaerota archaeon]
MRWSRILVADLDGTLTRGGEDLLKPKVRKALTSLKDRGWTLILATGRDRRYLMGRADLKGLFDAWVAEAGLTVYLPKTGECRCLASDAWRLMVKRLKALPFVEEKENTITFRSEYVDTVKAELMRLGIKATLRDNKGMMILLPQGIDKAVGVREALRLLGVEGFIAAVGDSEVDLELLELADFRAVVADADPILKEMADYVASREDGEGFVEVVESLLSRTA